MASDPRLDPTYREASPLPVVERPNSGLSGLAIGIIAVAIGLLLFVVLTSRRQTQGTPPISSQGVATEGASTTESLYIPPAPPPVVAAPPPQPVATPTPAPAPRIEPSPVRRRSTSDDDDEDRTPRAPTPRPLATPRPFITDNSQARPNPPNQENASLLAGSLQTLYGNDRARSGALANPSTTVPIGATIPAVLDTAIDTTRPSLVRAHVTQDVRGADGTRVLIPRGSQLTGEVRTDTIPGQNRANVVLTRLILPDHTTIPLVSPAADALGRGGVKGDVDGHFWQRFGGALLQSSLDIGAALAARSGSGGVVLLPGSISSTVSTGSSTSSLFRPSVAPPTIKVPAARTISIPVVRDLDFTNTVG